MNTTASIMAWLHILAAVIAIGGNAYGLLMLRPKAFQLLSREDAAKVMGAVALRFRWLVWTSMVVWVATGLWLATEFRGLRSVDLVLDTSAGRTLLVKSVLSVWLFANVLSITLPAKRLAWFRARQVRLIELNLALAAVIILLATFTVRSGGLF